MGIAQLEQTGGYASLAKLVEPLSKGGVGWQKVQRLVVYLSANQGGRLSGAKMFLWGQVKGLLGGERGSSASELLEHDKAVGKSRPRASEGRARRGSGRRDREIEGLSGRERGPESKARLDQG